jgi:hypothetical protein
MGEGEVLNKINLHEYFTNKEITDEELLIDLCKEVKNDHGWKEIKGGFLKNYFENESTSKLPILKRYESYFETVGFVLRPEYVKNNFLLSAKFKDYKTNTYELKGIIFIYAQYKPNLKNTMKNVAGELSRMLRSELEDLQEKFKKINSEKKESKKHLEIIILKFPLIF